MEKRFIEFMIENKELNKEELESKFFSMLLDEEKNKEYNFSKYIIESFTNKFIGNDKRISSTEWEVSVEVVDCGYGSLTGREFTTTSTRLEKLSKEESIEREHTFQTLLHNALESYKKHDIEGRIDTIRKNLFIHGRQDSLEEVSKYLNGIDSLNTKKDDFYIACERFLNLYYIETPKRYKLNFGRKSVSSLYKKYKETSDKIKEIEDKKQAEKDANTWFNFFKVTYDEYELFDEESQDEVISNLLLELGLKFNDLNDDWEIEDDSVKLKVEFGDNYSFEVIFSKKGLLEIGSMGRNRLRIKAV